MPESTNPVNEEDFPETAAPSQDPGRENHSVAPMHPPQRVPRFDAVGRNDHSGVQRFCPDDGGTNQSEKHNRYPNAGEGRGAA